MDVEYVPIKSSSSRKVWVELEFDPGRGVIACKRASHRASTLAEIEGREFTVPLQNIAASGKKWLIMCGLDGRLSILPMDEVQGEWLAHLGSIDPNSNKVRLLRFEEE